MADVAKRDRRILNHIKGVAIREKYCMGKISEDPEVLKKVIMKLPNHFWTEFVKETSEDPAVRSRALEQKMILIKNERKVKGLVTLTLEVLCDLISDYLIFFGKRWSGKRLWCVGMDIQHSAARHAKSDYFTNGYENS